MSEVAQAVFQAAMALSEAERLKLGQELIDSVDQVDPNDHYATPELAAEWGNEIKRRMDEAERDPSVLIPWEQARHQIFGETHE